MIFRGFTALLKKSGIPDENEIFGIIDMGVLLCKHLNGRFPKLGQIGRSKHVQAVLFLYLTDAQPCGTQLRCCKDEMRPDSTPLQSGENGLSSGGFVLVRPENFIPSVIPLCMHSSRKLENTQHDLLDSGQYHKDGTGRTIGGTIFTSAGWRNIGW
ncbi:uncharacterized protein LOC134202759 [Armigeres subalbatus]|uniref:uncharacterized protein LOC134202759 n=1 Tax=Armigeres subalbatus TaxID=124917 RepID=UPI002ED34F3A